MKPKTNRPDRRPLALLLLTLTALAAPAPAVGQVAASAELKALIDRIATGNEEQAAQATEQLADRVIGPLAEALEDVGGRPPDQQRRVSDALGRLTAVLRLRLYRAELPQEDKALFDDFVNAHRNLAEMLFHDDARRRLAALTQIPLEPGTGAGLMLVAKLHDWDVTVLEAALEATGGLKDEVVARGLIRFVSYTTDLVCAERLGPAEQDIAIAYTDLARLAIHQLGRLGTRDGVPVILAAIECLDRPGFRRLFQPAQALAALGRIGDDRAVPLLLRYVQSQEVYVRRAIGPGELVVQTVGDTALFALLRIYGLPPEAVGFYVGPDQNPITGFVDDAVRRAAVQAFMSWHSQNANRSPDARLPLTTQPTVPTHGAVEP